MSALLETRGVSKAFGEFRALEDVSIAVAPDELVSVIGPNGAGKTTLFNCMSGVYRPTSGSVMFEDRVALNTLAQHKIARLEEMLAAVRRG